MKERGASGAQEPAPVSEAVRPGVRFDSEVALDPAGVAAFAAACGDANPLHHDAGHAASTRFGRPIASGTQTSGLLMGLSASWFARHGAMLGLEFSFRFKRAVHADERLRLEWLVVRVRPNARLGGDIVDLRGRVQNSAGETVLGATGRVLLTDRL